MTTAQRTEAWTSAGSRPRVVLVHGAATTAGVWRRVVPLLTDFDFDVATPERPCTGRLDHEVAALAPLCEGALVVGVSGGATLGLAMLSEGVALAGAVLHEPAVGSLVPGLLDAVAAAYDAGGVDGFGTALYGPGWSPAEAPADPERVRRDLAMFRAFEPEPPAAAGVPVTITVGALSPAIRHIAALRLSRAFGYQLRPLPDARHAVHLDHPRTLANAIRHCLQVPSPVG